MKIIFSIAIIVSLIFFHTSQTYAAPGNKNVSASDSRNAVTSEETKEPSSSQELSPTKVMGTNYNQSLITMLPGKPVVGATVASTNQKAKNETDERQKEMKG